MLKNHILAATCRQSKPRRGYTTSLFGVRRDHDVANRDGKDSTP